MFCNFIDYILKSICKIEHARTHTHMQLIRFELL